MKDSTKPQLKIAGVGVKEPLRIHPTLSKIDPGKDSTRVSEKSKQKGPSMHEPKVNLIHKVMVHFPRLKLGRIKS